MPEANTEQYFKSTGLTPIKPNQFGISKMLIRAAERVNLAQLLDFMCDPKMIAYFMQDFQIEKHLQFSETLVNLVNEQLLLLPESANLKKRVETSLDHGYNHFRRVEKWKKWADANDKQLRSNLNYLYFSPSANFGIRFHDLVEVDTSLKEGHDETAALFSLGYLLSVYDSQIMGLSSGSETDPIPRSVWADLAWGTAYISANHSKPEKRPKLVTLLKEGVVDPMKLLMTAKKAAQKMDMTIYEYFEPFQLIKPFISSTERGEVEPHKFTDIALLKGLERQLLVVAAADKLDATFPAELAATRNIQTMPERPVFSKLKADHTLSLEEELQQRITEGGGHQSECDLNRILFELTRTKTFEGISPVIAHAFRIGLIKRSQFYVSAFPKFLMGDFSGYIGFYDRFEQGEIKDVLLKAGLDDVSANNVVTISDEDGRHRAIGVYLKKAGFEESALDSILQVIHSDRAKTEFALEKKYAKHNNMHVSLEENKRIKALLDLAIRRQQAELRPTAGMPEISLPYKGYYYIDLELWRRK